MKNDTEQLGIVLFEDRHADAFRELNLDWIEEFFFVEDLDRKHLDYPRASFIDTGGAILMAVLDGAVVGCCGLLKHEEGVYEVSKMAVEGRFRGAGIGRILLREVIAHAVTLGAYRLTILSNTCLEPAIRLYRSIGFREVPFESDAYARGNIAMVLELSAAQVGANL
jgi:ribosomal protein S18 acetylase RimI-like enzyme